MATPPILPGAEPWSAAGGPHGALVLHGFTGCPQSMRGLAEAFAAAGFAVELPRLPGHGTTIDDMVTTTWADWSRTAEAAYVDLASRCDRVVVAGLSMGATLTAWLATRHPEIAGIVVINGAFAPLDEGIQSALRGVFDSGVDRMPGPGGDIADPDQRELAYAQQSVAGLLSLMDALDALEPELPAIAMPSLVITSRQDHVVPPGSSDHFASRVGGPVEQVWLEASYHVATLDYDAAEIERRAVAFAQGATEPVHS